MKLRLDRGLAFVEVRIEHDGASLVLEDVLLDTGSAGCVFAARELVDIGIEPRGDETVYQVAGIGGGVEPVFSRRVERLTVGNLAAANFEIEVAAMNYTFALQ